MKKCPYCAEEIQEAAIICRYCGRDLPTAQEISRITDKNNKVSLSKKIITIILFALSVVLLIAFITINNIKQPIIADTISIPTQTSQQAITTNANNRNGKIPLLSPPANNISECKHWAEVKIDDVGKTVCIYGVVTSLKVSDSRKPNENSCPYPFNIPDNKCNTLIEFAPSSSIFLDTFYLITDIYDVNVGDCILAIDMVSKRDSLGNIPEIPVMFSVKHLFSCPPSLVP